MPPILRGAAGFSLGLRLGTRCHGISLSTRTVPQLYQVDRNDRHSALTARASIRPYHNIN